MLLCRFTPPGEAEALEGEVRGAEVVAFEDGGVLDRIAEACSLSAGDLLLTGTPAGVGFAMDPPRFLAEGDTVRVEIDRLGYIEHRILREQNRARIDGRCYLGSETGCGHAV